MNSLQVVKVIFITSLIVANMVTGKILNLFGLVVPGAAICYAFTFLCTDIVSELEGKKEAHRLVILGFICSIFATGLIYLTQILPAADFATGQAEAYSILLGINPRVVIASMVAYFISQWVDVNIFHAIRNKTGGRHKWLRNTASTSMSQILDTGIFITIAFWHVVPNIWVMIGSQYLLKLFISIMDTPVFYLLTNTKLIKANEQN